MNEKVKAWSAVGAVATLLGALGGVLIWWGDAYDRAVRHSLENKLAFHGYRLGLLTMLGGSMLVAAIGLLPRRTRSAAWLLSGATLVICSLAAAIIGLVRPNGFTIGAATYPTGLLLWTGPLLLVVFLVLALILDSNNCIVERNSALREVDLVTSHVKIQGEADALRTELAEAKRQHENDNTELKSKLAGAVSAHQETKKHRPYESQLVAAFAVSLGAEWQLRSPGSAISLNGGQGSLDKNFADFIGATEGACWLIELKREWSCVSTELRKAARRRQHAAMQTDAGIRKIAAACHWLGWGVKTGNEASLNFAQYWRTWGGREPPPGTINHLTFVERAFASGWSVGVSPNEFAIYMAFLAENGAPEDADAGDTFAALVFHRDSSGKIRYWIEPDIRAIGLVIEGGYRKIEERRIAMNLENERRKISHDTSNDIGCPRL